MADAGQMLAALRGRAEAWLGEDGPDHEPVSDDPARLIHELELRQVELEMQNAELVAANLDVEVALRRYTELFDFAPVGYLEVDRGTIIRCANLEAARLLGVERRRLSRKLLFDFVDGSSEVTFVSFLKDAWGHADPSTRCTCEVRLRRTHADPVDVLVAGMSVPGLGGRLLLALHDVTDRNRAEASAAAAESASAAKSEFLSSMSHELRTPLNAILGFAQLMKRDRREALSARHRERVERILDGGEHLMRLINDILDLTRIESGRMSLTIEPLAIREVLDEVRTTLDPLAVRQAVSLTLEPIASDVPRVRADRMRLVQIVMNFGSNAIKYNRPSGSVTLGVALTRPGFVRVSVEDTGIGIPADKQDKLFQPFQRAGQETGTVEGTGIGLVITQRLAGMLGGDVGFRSVPGTGSTFWVDVPADGLPDASAESVSKSSRSSE